MEKAKDIKTPLHQFSSDKSFRFVVTKNLEKKIRTYCALSPEREWSGVLFYKFEGDFSSGVTIYGNDFYLMDRGTPVHTEFDLNEPEITRYMVMEGLADHCIGLLHSHNKMKAFFSGEDSNTLLQYGESMNNFVSLVVNNDGPYVARLTRKASVKGTEKRIVEGSVTIPLFNTEDEMTIPYKREESKVENDTYVEYIDLAVEVPKVDMDYDLVERFGAVDHRCSSIKETKKESALPSWEPYAPKKYKDLELFPMEDFSLPKQFEYEDEISPELSAEVSKVNWGKCGFASYFSQLLLGTPFANSTPLRDADLGLMYKRRFKTEVDFCFWFETWLDFIVSDFATEMPKAKGEFSEEELILGKFYKELRDMRMAYKNEMLSSILQRLI